MFGIRLIKVDPTDFVLQYKRGKIVREGAGLSFSCFTPTTSLVLVPICITVESAVCSNQREKVSLSGGE